MSNTELVRPDMLFTRNNDDSGRRLDQPWQLLNPCPYCGAVPHDSPDGTHADGDPRWNFPHCWKCGFRPGSQQAEGLERTRQEFAAFQSWQRSQNELSAAPDTTTADFQQQGAADRMVTVQSETPSQTVQPPSSFPWGQQPPQPQSGSGAADDAVRTQNNPGSAQ